MATPAAKMSKPANDEYNPYYQKYVALLPDGDFIEILKQQIDITRALLGTINEAQADSRYGPDKWSIKEVVGHLIDTERVFAYRAMRFARNDLSTLSGYEQDDYVANGNFDARTLADLAVEFEYLRRSNICFFQGLSEDAWARRGVANNSEVSVRALAHIIAGHEVHHVEILKARYLGAAANQ
jgi:uncharacterized damage-inducible protein DinB